MNIQGIALDLDRTTLNNQGKLSDETERVLRKVIEQGIHVIVASGRSFGSLPQSILRFPGIEYAITSNGAAIYHMPSGTCIHSNCLTPQSVLEILYLAENADVMLETFIRGQAYADANYVAHPERYQDSQGAVNYIKRTRKPIEDIRGFILEHQTELDCIDLVVLNSMERDRLCELAKHTVSDVYLTSAAPQLLEIAHRDAGKHQGVCFLMQHLNIPQEAIAAFGDGDNDVDMLEFVGCGIAVENGTPACLAAADYISKSNEEDGVAYGIEYILGL